MQERRDQGQRPRFPGGQGSQGLRVKVHVWGPDVLPWGFQAPGLSLSLSQLPIWKVVTRPQVSLPLGVRILPVFISAVPAYQVLIYRWTRFSPDPGDAGHGAENPPPAAAGGAGPDRDLSG